MKTLTAEELKALEAVPAGAEDVWRKVCLAIKARGPRPDSYPDDWFEKVIEPGLMDRKGFSGITMTFVRPADEAGHTDVTIILPP